LADALFVLIAGVPWLGEAMQRALDRRRDQQVDRRLSTIEERIKPLTPFQQRVWDEQRQRRDAQAERAARRGFRS